MVCKNLCNILGQNYLLIATNFNLIGSFGIIILYLFKKINQDKNIFNYSLLIMIFFPSIFFGHLQLVKIRYVLRAYV